MTGQKKRGDDMGFQISTKNKIILILAGSVMLSMAVGFSRNMQDNRITGISRPEAGQTKEVQINAYTSEGEDPYPVNVKLSSRSYTDEEITELLEKADMELEETVKGSNPDLEHVSTKLELKNTYAGGLVKAEWSSSDYETVSFDGTVSNEDFDEDESRYVALPVRLSMGERFKDSIVEVTVTAPVQDETGRYVKEIKNAIDEQDAKHSGDDTVPLPEAVEGREIYFKTKDEEISPLIFIPMGIAGAVCVWFYEKQKLQRLERERCDALSGDYAALSSKLSLLCGAGMTVFAAWRNVAEGYLKDRKAGLARKRESYEKMNEALEMMNNGMSETEAYTRFGEACGVREYKKLGAYLSEYVKKGTGDLKKLLQNEARESFVRQKASVKVRAEEAGTRLLFPMMLMLGVVMAIVLLPAAKSFVM